MKMKMLPLLALVLLAARPFMQQPTVEIAVGKSIAAGAVVDTASSFDAAVGTVAGWTRVSGMTAGSKITHVWIHGVDSSKVELNIGGSPWRTYSRKTMGEGSTGDWKLEVRDASGAVIASKSFKIG